MSSLPSLIRSEHVANLGQQWLFPRKGGGGGGHGSSSGGKASSGGSKSSSSSSKAPGSTSSSSSKSSSFGLSSSIGASGKSATAYSAGGGKPFTLSSASPFSGRQAGGGTRTQIYGTWQYGSGYPYGSTGSYVDNRPLPYIFWPVPMGSDYYGSDVYAKYNGTVRPGGNVTSAIVTGNGFPNTTEIYRIIGDQLSVRAVLDALVTNCTAKNTTLELFNPEVYAYPQPEQIIQWYRASTFGLGLDSYNNTAALASNIPSSNHTNPPALSSATPLPSGLNMTFLTCINTTIAASVPLVDPPAKKHLSQLAIFGIINAAVFVVVILGVCLAGCVSRGCHHPSCCRRRGPKTLKSKETNIRGHVKEEYV
ncbi:hypothetical protein NEOLEDRAFT_506176 [Neolentinus lepideus HHB14362 ss-1]|uniref:Uncharacterized protein n=1 Tax=Neolentinus lepideus HHB14362 ss-1 TaxID=1314782 RepID=A0A165RJU2_9AGAM|nr:hypothetical protein NEOLEDRAFT_506176 [Neolentinus lepideus HHB14362 ss-1]